MYVHAVCNMRHLYNHFQSCILLLSFVFAKYHNTNNNNKKKKKKKKNNNF